MFCSSSDWELTTEPYAHQRAAVEKLSRLNVGALFMDMGTGKTRTAIELVWLRRKLISKCEMCIRDRLRRPRRAPVPLEYYAG